MQGGDASSRFRNVIVVRKKKVKAIDELGLSARWTTEARRRCQWEAQETTCEEK